MIFIYYHKEQKVHNLAKKDWKFKFILGLVAGLVADDKQECQIVCNDKTWYWQ